MAKIKGEKLNTIRETAQRWGQAEVTIRTRIARGQIGIVRLGRSIRIPESEIERIIEAGFIPARSEGDAR